MAFELRSIYPHLLAGAIAGVALVALAGCKGEGDALPKRKPPGQVAGEAVAGWVDFESAEGKFTAKFPSTPQTQRIPTPAPGGVIEQVLVQAENEEMYYAIMFVAYPGVEDIPATETLDDARDGALAQGKGTLTSEREITLGAFPGRELRMTASNEEEEVVIHQRIYLVERKMFSLVVVRAANQEAHEQAFFDAFALSN